MKCDLLIKLSMTESTMARLNVSEDQLIMLFNRRSYEVRKLS